MAADVLFLVLLFFGLIFGLRRGIFKELIAFAALVVAFAAARTARDVTGDLLHTSAGLEAHAAQFVGAAGTFILVAFLLNVIGRLLLRKLRDPDADNKLEGAAQKAVDASQGKQKVGPITFITNPFASAEKGFVYWTDKAGGGALGLVKGAVGAYLLFGIIYYVDMAVDGHWSITDSIQHSKAAEIFTNNVEPLLSQINEFKLLENAAKLDRTAHDPGTKPNTIERIAVDDSWAPLKALPSVTKLFSDPQVQAAWNTKDKDGRRDVGALIKLPQVRALLTDPEFRKAFAQVDVEAVIQRALAPPADSK